MSDGPMDTTAKCQGTNAGLIKAKNRIEWPGEMTQPVGSFFVSRCATCACSCLKVSRCCAMRSQYLQVYRLLT